MSLDLLGLGGRGYRMDLGVKLGPTEEIVIALHELTAGLFV
jgi:hypothetical protein